MKHFTQFWLVLLGLLAAQPLSAQLYEVPLNDRIDRSTYIFEGKVLESNSFYGPGGRMIYTSHLVQVYSVFKGEFPGDQVEIVTEGGRVGDQAVWISHNLELGPNQHGVFFANPTNRPSDRQPNSGLSLRVYAGLQGFVKFHFDGINPKASGPFHVYRQPETELFPLIEARTGQARRNGSATASRSIPFQPTVKYYFSYPQLTQVGGQTLLDFEVQAQVDGGVYEFGDSRIYLEYDTSFIGSNLVGNGQITLTAGDLVNTTDYTLSMTDYGSNILEIHVDAADPPLNLKEIDVFLEDVVHVQVDVSGINPGIEALFEESLMQGESYYYDQVSGSYVQFPFVWAGDSVIYQASAVGDTIADFLPKTITAGTEELLFIFGSGFGNSRGQVFFQNADKDSAGAYVTPHKSDYVQWTDSSIIVKVPSVDSLDGSPAGSGVFLVAPSVGGNTISSNAPLEVSYAIDNVKFGNSNEQIILRLSDDNETGGLTLFYASSVPDTVKPVFEAALDEWRCQTGLNFTISENVVQNVDSFNLFNDTSLIRFATLDTGVLGIAQTNIEFCTDQFDNTNIFVSEVDIVFGDTIPWFTSLNEVGITNAQFDFYSVAVHELGHGHLLEHALSDSKIMYPFLSRGVATKRAPSSDDLDGGNYVMALSQLLIVCVDEGFTLNPMLPFVCTPNSIISDSEFSGIKPFPNPAKDRIYLPLYDHEEILYMTLRDQVGRTIITQNHKGRNGELLEIELPRSISPGVYFLEIKISDYHGNWKIIID